MLSSSTCARLRSGAWAAASERRGAASSLDLAIDGLPNALDAASVALTPDVWDSAVAAVRREELRRLVADIAAVADEVAELAAQLRVDAARFDEGAAWYDRQYRLALEAEQTATTPVSPGGGPG